jgi:hypothetical protein
VRWWYNFELKIRGTDAAVRKIRETPTFSLLAIVVIALHLSACRNLIRAEARSSISRTLQATEQIQNQNDYENGSDYAV